MAGVGRPINDVAEVLGHEQTSTTLDRYPSDVSAVVLTFCGFLRHVLYRRNPTASIRPATSPATAALHCVDLVDTGGTGERYCSIPN